MCCSVRISSSLFDWSGNVNSFEPSKKKMKNTKKEKKTLSIWSNSGDTVTDWYFPGNTHAKSMGDLFILSPILSYAIYWNSLQMISGGNGPCPHWLWLQHLWASVAFQKPQRVLINHIWSRSLLGFITANSLVIRKTVLHVKSKNMTDGYL